MHLLLLLLTLALTAATRPSDRGPMHECPVKECQNSTDCCPALQGTCGKVNQKDSCCFYPNATGLCSRRSNGHEYNRCCDGYGCDQLGPRRSNKCLPESNCKPVGTTCKSSDVCCQILPSGKTYDTRCGKVGSSSACCLQTRRNLFGSQQTCDENTAPCCEEEGAICGTFKPPGHASERRCCFTSKSNGTCQPTGHRLTGERLIGFTTDALFSKCCDGIECEVRTKKCIVKYGKCTKLGAKCDPLNVAAPCCVDSRSDRTMPECGFVSGAQACCIPVDGRKNLQCYGSKNGKQSKASPEAKCCDEKGAVCRYLSDQSVKGFYCCYDDRSIGTCSSSLGINSGCCMGFKCNEKGKCVEGS